MSKERLTVTIDSHLLEAANEAVAGGRADSISGWVNIALEERAAKERRLRALADAVHAFEKEFGEITDAELAAQQRMDRNRAHVVRAHKRRKKS